MKNKAKLFLLLALVLTIAVVLSACGGKGESKSESTATPTKTQVAEKSSKATPTKAPTKAAAKESTPVPTAVPTADPTAESHAAEATEAAGEFEKLKASQEALKKVTDKFDSYRSETSMVITFKLKDGSEKKMDIRMTSTVVQKPEKKFELKLEGNGLEEASGMHVIAVGNKAWMKMGDKSPWMELPVDSVDNMIKSMGNIVSDDMAEVYAENSLKKGTKKFGPVKCNFYEFDKHDIEKLTKKYPNRFTEEEKTAMHNIKDFKGSGCVTKEGVVLTSSMSMSTDDLNDTGFTPEMLQEKYHIAPDQVKVITIDVRQGLVEVNKNFDIKPPQTGG